MKDNINERASIRASIKKKDITGNTINIVNEYVVDNGVCYYDIPTFTNKFGLKDKTIRRRISVAEEKPNKWDYTIKIERKQYASIGLLGFKKKNLIGKYRKDYAEFLAIYDWDTIGSLTAKNCLTIQSARKNMESLFKALKAKFPHESILFFFVTERNPGFDGYHSHFVLKYYGDNKKVIDNWIITYLKKYNQKIESNNYGNFNSVHIDNYDYNRRWEWIVYITKQIEQISDGYDFLKTGDI
jgi:hypothetical protein